MDGKDVLSILGTLVLMIAVFVGAYYFSKYFGKHYYRTRYGATKNLSILESHAVGKDSALLIVKAAERTFLVGATPREFTLLSELDPETLQQPDESENVRPDFSSAFKNAIKNFGRKQD
ncbi:MAG: FliO/MopB family protein [Oscillospiraceae bacterium]